MDLTEKALALIALVLLPFVLVVMFGARGQDIALVPSFFSGAY